MNDVTIGEGNLNGKGVYANRDFAKNEIVINYNLKQLSKEEYKNLPKSEGMFTHTHRGVVYLYSEPECYVNHSPTPNTFQDLERKCDIANKAIRMGEMITTDATKDNVSYV